jgi:hypothetical protein
MPSSLTVALRHLMGRRAIPTRAQPSKDAISQRWARIADVPVFDAQHRQVGFIAAPADRGCRRFTPAAWMQRCMTEPVC